MPSPECELRCAVLTRAAVDARANVSKNDSKDAYWHFKWSQGPYFKILCERAGLDHDWASEGFKTIYEAIEKGEETSIRRTYTKQGELFVF